MLVPPKPSTPRYSERIPHRIAMTKYLTDCDNIRPSNSLDGTLNPKIPLRWESNLNETERYEFGLLLDQYAGKSKRGSWTVRLSWPATVSPSLSRPLSSFPARKVLGSDPSLVGSSQMPSDFKLEIIPWKSARTDLTSSSHDRLLRVTRWPTGIRIPEGTPLTSWTHSPASVDREAEDQEDKIIFDILVEPLTFGVIPSTAWPTIGSVVMMAIGGFFFATRLVLPLWIDPLLGNDQRKME